MTFTRRHVEAAAAHLLRRAESRVERREQRRRRIVERLEEASALLHGQFGATRAYLFGSVLAPWFGEDSDVDIAVEGLPTDKVYAAERLLLALFGAPVDLLRLEELEASFTGLLETDGRRFL